MIGGGREGKREQQHNSEDHSLLAACSVYNPVLGSVKGGAHLGELNASAQRGRGGARGPYSS